MGKFFKGKVKRDRASLIKYTLMGVGIFFIILLFIIAALSRSRRVKPILDVKDSITVEINSELPDTLEFFTKFEHFDKKKIKISEGTLDLTKLGEYTVTISAEGLSSQDVKVIVTDTTAPEVKIKNEYAIASGESYTAADFVASCEDNSKAECNYEFYDGATNEDGQSIDYSSYTAEGSYAIKIVAKDESGNTSDVKDSILVIGKGSSKTAECKYGNLEYSATRVTYPVAVIVGDEVSGCALNWELWDDKNTQAAADKFYNDDYAKIKKDLETALNTYYPNGAKIVAYPHYISVINDSLTGLVGYGIHVDIYIVDANYKGTIDSKENLVVSYYLKSDKSRVYSTNKYNLK